MSVNVGWMVRPGERTRDNNYYIQDRTPDWFQRGVVPIDALNGYLVERLARHIPEVTFQVEVHTAYDLLVRSWFDAIVHFPFGIGEEQLILLKLRFGVFHSTSTNLFPMNYSSVVTHHSEFGT